MNIDFSEKEKELDALSRKLLEEPISSTQEWGGANVVITSQPPQKQVEGFYPEPRYVVTHSAKELSWLFVQLRDVFSNLYDGASKVEFFGRLANAALRYQSRYKGNEKQYDLLIAVLNEAYSILDDMKEGVFEYLLVAPGNVIADDLIALMRNISREAQARGLTPEILDSILKEQ
jgi:hypothetical protein